MKIIFLILFSLSLWSSDILTNYRINGIKNIEKEMDIALANKKYWEDYLKHRDTTFGYIEKYNSILTCNKTKSILKLYKREKNSDFVPIEQYSAFVGKEKGDKIKEGDLRTPIGIYDLTKTIKKLDSFYGPLAFATSYPNIYDKYRGRDGHGIWIHGLPTEQTREKFTKGCIAIDNDNILCLEKEIDITNTLLIIDKDKVEKNISKNKLATILSQLYMWRYTWLYNDIDGYLKFYSRNFIKNDTMDIEKFKRYKTRIFNKKEKKIIIFKHINVIPYPNTSDVYQITFREIYKSDSFKFTGDKTLIVKMDDDKMKIFTEK